MNFPDVIDTSCENCGKEMVVVDAVCFKYCLKCAPDDEKERYLEIMNARNTLDGESSVDSTLDTDAGESSGGGRKTFRERELERAENDPDAEVLEF